MHLINLQNSVYNNFSVNTTKNKTHNKHYRTKHQEQPSFKGTSTKIKTSPSKNMISFAMKRILSILKIKNRESRNIEGLQIEYFNIKKTTQNAIESAIINAKSKSKKSDFMDNVEINVANKFSSLDGKTSFRQYVKGIKQSSILGMSFYSDGCLPKCIAVKETSNTDIRFLLMHEFGHQFDRYYGHDHNADFALAREKMLTRMAKKDSLSVYSFPIEGQDFAIDFIFNMKSGLNSKEEFIEAFRKDLENIAQIKKTGRGIISKDINLYTSCIDFSQKITDYQIHFNQSRSEIYATLFSYAIGEDNGDREAFLNNFSNCYNVVKNDMKKYLGI